MQSSESGFLPGQVVQTIYGVGVISAAPIENDFYQVVLWRVPGKSIGSASVGFLQPSAIVRELPVAPGMTTHRKNDADKRKLMVNCYIAALDSYSVSPIKSEIQAVREEAQLDAEREIELSASQDADADADFAQRQFRKLSRISMTSFSVLSSASRLPDTDESFLVPANELAPASSAKFYPLLQELIRRGDHAARSTATFVEKHRPEMEKLVEKTNSLVIDGADRAKVEIEKRSAPDVVDGVETSIKNIVPKDDEVKQLLSMLRDDDLTLLLEKGKDRLQQLVQKEIPAATESALAKTGIRVVEEDDSTSDNPYKTAIVKSQRVALQAVENLLAELDAGVTTKDVTDLADSLRVALDQNFSTMFDTLARAAKSDRTLDDIFTSLSSKTTEWQETTGRLMATRSASLFMEGASRIQARAATLFSKNQTKFADEIGSKLTKAFTEGDAAVAKLKSIELGDQVRHRLVTAIEMRSESIGGLDGIIAGALTSLKSGAQNGPSGDQIDSMLVTMQKQASSLTKEANESLISVLSKKSEYRDLALLKIEQVLCDLESQFGDDLSPEEIASIARGEGGTSKLFEPIAKRAAKEIEKQLDVAEESVEDTTMLEVLRRVRKIVSGELTLTAVMDEVVNILNDDKIVSASENVLAASENVLDAIEGVSGNKVVDDVLQIAEKAGITKDSVMQGIEKLDVNELLDTAGHAMTDENARKALLSDATDTALDFILRILPSMPIPPFDGVRDGLVYHVSNLSMQGFKVKKENIVVEVAGMRATKRQKSKGATAPGDGETASATSHSEASLGTPIDTESSSGDYPPILRTESTDSSVVEMDTTSWLSSGRTVGANELLIIDVSNISAVFNDAVWSFEQTYLPYLKGNGRVDVKMSNGAIRLVFELRRRARGKDMSPSFEATEWEPVLCLHDRKCSIGSVDVTMQGGGRIAWVVNKLASIFKGVLRDYVVKTILGIIADKSGWILAQLNGGLSPYWDVIMRTAKLDMKGLEVATSEDIMAAKELDDSNLVELVWRDPIPLGMNLLLNDESGQLKVVDFPRGSQARSICEKRNLDPKGFEGATIVAVNGVRYLSDEELFDALRDPGRPKTVLFELADSEVAERIKKFVAESQGGNAEKMPYTPSERVFFTRQVEFVHKGELGIEFTSSVDNLGLVVRSFIEGDGGVILAAERHEEISEGSLLTHINGQLVLGENGAGRALALDLLQKVGSERPLVLAFADAHVRRVVFEKPKSTATSIGGPEEFDLKEIKSGSGSKRIVLKGFNDVDGVAEYSGVLLGDHLVFVNGISVGAGCRWLDETSIPSMEDVLKLITDRASYPIGLTFARPKQESHNRLTDYFTTSPKANQDTFMMDSADTICVTADRFEQLGCVLEMTRRRDVIVSSFDAVAGPVQTTMQQFRDPQTRGFHLSIDSINGEFVPAYATAQIVKNAMVRSWKTEGRVEVVFCDDDRREWLKSLK